MRISGKNVPKEDQEELDEFLGDPILYCRDCMFYHTEHCKFDVDEFTEWDKTKCKNYFD